LHVMGQTLDQYCRGLAVPGLEAWRAPCIAAVSQVVSIVLKHARPQFVHLAVWSSNRAVHVKLAEGGRLWLGNPEPAQVLAELADDSRAVFDQAVHESHRLGNTWILSKEVATSASGSGHPAAQRSTRARAPASVERSTGLKRL